MENASSFGSSLRLMAASCQRRRAVGHLTEMTAGAGDCGRLRRQPDRFPGFRQFPSIRHTTRDYRELLANPRSMRFIVRAAPTCTASLTAAAISAGQHLMGEKPFGIDAGPTTRFGVHCRASGRFRAMLLGVSLLPGRSTGSGE